MGPGQKESTPFFQHGRPSTKGRVFVVPNWKARRGRLLPYSKPPPTALSEESNILCHFLGRFYHNYCDSICGKAAQNRYASGAEYVKEALLKRKGFVVGASAATTAATACAAAVTTQTITVAAPVFGWTWLGAALGAQTTQVQAGRQAGCRQAGTGRQAGRGHSTAVL